MFRKIWHIARWVFVALVFAYIALVIYSYPHEHEARLAKAAVAKIGAQQLTMDDVDGKQLPPPPDPSMTDATVAGVDANGNGIRDDVELAIFAKYPTSTPVRAAELQYSMELQVMLTSVFNAETWKAAAAQEDRGYQCIGETYPRDDLQTYTEVTNKRITEVEALVLNTPTRKAAKDRAFSFTTSYELPADNFCDIDPGTL